MTRRARAAAAADRVVPTPTQRSHVAPITGGPVDAAPYINQAIRDACNSTNGFRVVEIPGNERRVPICTPVTISGDAAAGLTLRGFQGVDGLNRHRLAWNGPNAGTAVELHARGVVAEGFTVCPGTGTLARGISVTSTAGALPTTKVTIRRCRVDGAMNGIVLGDMVNGVYPYNNEHTLLEDVYFEGAGNACVYIPNDTGQVKALSFVRCAFLVAPFGIWANRASYKTDGCVWGAISTAAAHHVAPCDGLVFHFSETENVARFLTTGGPTSGEWLVKIDGGRFNCHDGLAEDGRFISYLHPGPLVIDSATFEAAADTNWNIWARTPSPETGATVDTRGCVFPLRANSDHAGLVQGINQWSRRACRVRLSGRLPDVDVTQ